MHLTKNLVVKLTGIAQWPIQEVSRNDIRDALECMMMIKIRLEHRPSHAWTEQSRYCWENIYMIIDRN